MTCERIVAKDGTVIIACSRGPAPRLKKCATCGKPGALLCDGCDSSVCRECAVSPATEQDFCPSCFGPVFRQWLRDYEQVLAFTQEHRREAFRQWARIKPGAFDVIERTSEGLAARALGCNQDAGDRQLLSRMRKGTF